MNWVHSTNAKYSLVPLQYFLTIILMSQLSSAQPCPTPSEATWIVFLVLLAVSVMGPAVSSPVSRVLCWRDPKGSNVAPQGSGTTRSPHVKVQSLFLFYFKIKKLLKSLGTWLPWETYCWRCKQTSKVLSRVFQLWDATLSTSPRRVWWGVLIPLLENSPTSPLVPSAVRRDLNYMDQLNLSAHLRDNGQKRFLPAKVELSADFFRVQVKYFIKFLNLDCPKGVWS